MHRAGSSYSIDAWSMTDINYVAGSFLIGRRSERLVACTDKSVFSECSFYVQESEKLSFAGHVVPDTCFSTRFSAM